MTTTQDEDACSFRSLPYLYKVDNVGVVLKEEDHLEWSSSKAVEP